MGHEGEFTYEETQSKAQYWENTKSDITLCGPHMHMLFPELVGYEGRIVVTLLPIKDFTIVRGGRARPLPVFQFTECDSDTSPDDWYFAYGEARGVSYDTDTYDKEDWMESFGMKELIEGKFYVSVKKKGD